MIPAKDTQPPREWTASRCVRILRPITSRTSELRATNGPRNQKAGDVPGPLQHIARSQHVPSPGSKDDPDWMASKPKKTTNRQYARLPALSSTESGYKLAAGTFTLDTPLVSRLRGIPALDVGERGHDHVLVKSRTERRTDVFDAKFRSPEDALNFRSQKLCEATLTLVEATNDCRTPHDQRAFFPTSGAPSLRAMCARNYAREIVELDELQEMARADERFDVVSEAYQLAEETFGGVVGSDYLRAIVREHGVLLFSKFVSKSLINKDHVLPLIRRMTQPTHCQNKVMPASEVERIATSWIQDTTPETRCCGRNTLWGNIFNKLTNVSAMMDGEARLGFDFRQLDNLIKSSIPLSWLGARRMTALWGLVFNTFVGTVTSETERNTAIRDVTAFLERFVALDCGSLPTPPSASVISRSNIVPDYLGPTGCPKCPRLLPHTRIVDVSDSAPHFPMNHTSSHKRLSNTLSNSVTSMCEILAAFVIATGSVKGETRLKAIHISVGPIASLLGNLSMGILLRETATRDLTKDFPFVRTSSILTATLIVSLAAQHCGQMPAGFSVSVNDLVRELETLSNRASSLLRTNTAMLDSLSEIVFSVARGAGKLLGDDGFDSLRQILATFSSPEVTSSTSNTTRSFLSELSASSAQLFAESVKTEEAVCLAAELDACLESTDSLAKAKTPLRRVTVPQFDREGLKWEESICEYVHTTPALPSITGISRTSILPPFPPHQQAHQRVGQQLVVNDHDSYEDSFKACTTEWSISWQSEEESQVTDAEEADELDDELEIELADDNDDHQFQASGFSDTLSTPFSSLRKECSTPSSEMTADDTSDLKIHQSSNLNDQLKNTQAHVTSSELHKKTSKSWLQLDNPKELKRNRSSDTIEVDSDDELSLPHESHKKRRTEQTSTRATRNTEARNHSSEGDSDDDINDRSEEVSYTTSHLDLRGRSGGVCRRNPRGTFLRSALSLQVSSTSPLPQEESEPDEISDQDELDDCFSAHNFDLSGPLPYEEFVANHIARVR